MLLNKLRLQNDKIKPETTYTKLIFNIRSSIDII